MVWLICILILKKFDFNKYLIGIFDKSQKKSINKKK